MKLIAVKYIPFQVIFHLWFLSPVYHYLQYFSKREAMQPH